MPKNNVDESHSVNLKSGKAVIKPHDIPMQRSDHQYPTLHHLVRDQIKSQKFKGFKDWYKEKK